MTDEIRDLLKRAEAKRCYCWKADPTSDDLIEAVKSLEEAARFARHAMQLTLVEEMRKQDIDIYGT